MGNLKAIKACIDSKCIINKNGSIMIDELRW